MNKNPLVSAGGMGLILGQGTPPAVQCPQKESSGTGGGVHVGSPGTVDRGSP